MKHIVPSVIPSMAPIATDIAMPQETDNSPTKPVYSESVLQEAKQTQAAEVAEQEDGDKLVELERDENKQTKTPSIATPTKPVYVSSEKRQRFANTPEKPKFKSRTCRELKF